MMLVQLGEQSLNWFFIECWGVIQVSSKDTLITHAQTWQVNIVYPVLHLIEENEIWLNSDHQIKTSIYEIKFWFDYFICYVLF